MGTDVTLLDTDELEEFSLPGLAHKTVSDTRGEVAVWKQELEPDAETPMHYHECREIILVREGGGRVVLEEGSDRRIGENTTVIIPGQVPHQIITGDKPLKHYAVLEESPARVFSPDGELIQLPWSPD